MHIGALTDLHSRLVVDGRVAHALFDLAGHGEESLFNVVGILGGGLKEGDPQAVGELLNVLSALLILSWKERPHLCHSVLDHFLICHVALVAYKELVHTLCGVTVNLLQPLLDVVERVHVGNIIDNADTMSSAVVR